jgi:hypothetical protein
LHQYNIFLLWSLKKMTDPSLVYRQDRDVSVDVFQDQRRPNYNINVQASLWKMTLSRIVEAFFEWLFNIKKGDPGLLYQRLGNRVIFASIVMGCILNITSPTQVGMFSRVVGGSGDAERVLIPINGNATVYSNIQHGIPPTMPDADAFLARAREPGKQLYIHVSDADTRKYLLFHEPPLEKQHTMIVRESLCGIVPAGREVLFDTRLPPAHDANMMPEVKYVLKASSVSRVTALIRRILNKPIYLRTSSWQVLRENWNEVDFVGYSISVQALPAEKLPEGRSDVGGLVCF